jgi:hypothetical protein
MQTTGMSTSGTISSESDSGFVAEELGVGVKSVDYTVGQHEKTT